MFVFVGGYWIIPGNHIICVYSVVYMHTCGL